MSQNFYIILHLTALTALVFSLGALWGLYAHENYNKKIKRLLLAVHGIAMFFIFFAGFGLIAKTNINWPWPLWIYKKLLIWLVLGVMPLLLKRSGQNFPSSKKHFLSLLLTFAFVFTAVLFIQFK